MGWRVQSELSLGFSLFLGQIKSFSIPFKEYTKACHEAISLVGIGLDDVLQIGAHEDQVSGAASFRQNEPHKEERKNYGRFATFIGSVYLLRLLSVYLLRLLFVW